VPELWSFGEKMRRVRYIGVAGALMVVVGVWWYFSRPIVVVADEAPLWSSEYDASRQSTIFPGPGTPLGYLKAGTQLRVLWSVYGKDYLAYVVVARHLGKGWLLCGQKGIAMCGSCE
jgi:hypothetical protein